MNDFLNIALGTAIIIAVFASVKPLRIAWLKWILKRSFLKLHPSIPMFTMQEIQDVRESLSRCKQFLPEHIVKLTKVLLDTREMVLKTKQRMQDAIDEKKNSD